MVVPSSTPWMAPGGVPWVCVCTPQEQNPVPTNQIAAFAGFPVYSEGENKAGTTAIMMSFRSIGAQTLVG